MAGSIRTQIEKTNRFDSVRTVEKKKKKDSTRWSGTAKYSKAKHSTLQYITALPSIRVQHSTAQYTRERYTEAAHSITIIEELLAQHGTETPCFSISRKKLFPTVFGGESQSLSFLHRSKIQIEIQAEQVARGSHLVFYKRRHREVVEELGEAVPHRGVPVLAEAFVVETVDLGDLTRLVVAPQNRYAVFETDLTSGGEPAARGSKRKKMKRHERR